MKLVWSPETASKAYIDTVKSCDNSKEFGVAELLSAMAAGWNAKLIVHAWSSGTSTVTSVGLAIAARHTGGRHVCLVTDERSKSEYIKSLQDSGASSPGEIVVGEAEMVMETVVGVDFLVVDCKRRDFARVLRFAKVSNQGAVLVWQSAGLGNLSKLSCRGILPRGTRVVRSVSLPVGQGLHVIHVGSNGGGSNAMNKPSRWMRHVDERSGEEHVYRERN